MWTSSSKCLLLSTQEMTASIKKKLRVLYFVQQLLFDPHRHDLQPECIRVSSYL